MVVVESRLIWIEYIDVLITAVSCIFALCFVLYVVEYVAASELVARLLCLKAAYIEVGSSIPNIIAFFFTSFCLSFPLFIAVDMKALSKLSVIDLTNTQIYDKFKMIQRSNEVTYSKISLRLLISTSST